MWLVPAFARVSSAASRGYYDLEVAGRSVPATGPVLLVANHPNSLLDPAIVCTAAGRPVRFLAKASLFSGAFGWLFHAVGAIPVYRRMDDPSLVERNVEAFRRAHDALAGGSAIGIFPEGMSHDLSAIAPLKTGAARIALGAVRVTGAVFPIIPVGLVFRQKERFRSPALVVVGAPVEWSDLATADAEDVDAVRELTRRIENALRAVTVNLERWEDAPMVECAEQIFAAERGAPRDPAARVARLRETTEALAWVRAGGDPRWLALAADVRHHARVLRLLRLRPAELRDHITDRDAIRWSLRRLPLVAPLAVAIVLAGMAVFWIPWRLTKLAADRVAPRSDVRPFYRLILGTLLFALWIALLAALVWSAAGAVAGIAALVLLPVWGAFVQAARQRYSRTWTDVRRFLLVRGQRRLVRELRVRQQELAQRLAELYAAYAGRRPRAPVGGTPVPPVSPNAGR